MPGWIMHLVTANEVSKKLQVDKNSFLFGNLLPDVYNGYIVSNLSNHIDHGVSHYDTKEKIEGKTYSLPDIEGFIQLYKNKLNNSVILGYATHLMTDYYWNRKTYTKKYIYNEQGKVGKVRLKNGEILETKENLEAMHIKQKDFATFSKFLVQNEEVLFPKYQEELINKSNELKYLKTNQEDMKKVFQYITYMPKQIKENIADEDYLLYSQEQLMEGMQESVIEITKKLEKKLGKEG